MQPKQLARSLRKNLLNQKKKLEEYLVLLDSEGTQNHMSYDDADKLISHIELENNIVKELESFKKYISPIEVVYYNMIDQKEENILNLKTSIDILTKKVITKTNENKEKLETILVSIDTQLTGLAKKKLSKAIYNNTESKLLDVTG